MRMGFCLTLLVSCLLPFSAAAIAKNGPPQNSKSKPDSSTSNDLLLPPSEDLVRAWGEIGGKACRNGAGFSRG